MIWYDTYQAVLWYVAFYNNQANFWIIDYDYDNMILILLFDEYSTVYICAICFGIKIIG